MKNKTSKTKIIILVVIAIIIVLLIGFLVYRSKSRPEKEGGMFSNIFSILPSSREITPLETIAGVNIKKDEPVYISGINNKGELIISPAKDRSNQKEIYGYAKKDIAIGEWGDIEVNKDYIHGPNVSLEEITDLIDFKFECSDGIDNDGDGFIDEDDPNCHLEGDINKQYLSNHISEKIPPLTIPDWNMEIPDYMGPNEFVGACRDKLDNDGDGLIDEKDPNCHLDGDIKKEYLPDHYSESRYATSHIDLSAGPVTFDAVKTDEKTTFYSTIYNYGTHSTGYEFYSFFDIKKIGEKAEEDIRTEIVKIPEISGGSNYLSSVTYQVEDDGIYKIRVCADKKDASDEGTIKETNENNNCGPWVQFTVDFSMPNIDEGKLPECSDGIDNDGDGFVDEDDPNCHVGGTMDGDYLPNHDSESSRSYQCNDGIDNDGDGFVDEDDPSCHVGGTLDGEYLPKHDSESERSYQCNDGVDNDGDGFVDEDDPSCHVGGTMSGNYVPTHDSEENAPPSPNICLSLLPLEFTSEEKADLDDLLRRFYLLATELKDENDINIVYQELTKYQLLREEVELLIERCNTGVNQLRERGYGNLIVQYGNPWYKYDSRGSYLKNIDREILDSLKPTCQYYGPYEEKESLTKKKNAFGLNTSSKKDFTEKEKENVCLLLGKSGTRAACEVYDTKDADEQVFKKFNLTTLIIDPTGGTYAVNYLLEKIFGNNKVNWARTGCRWATNERANLEEYEILLNVW